MSCLSGAGVYDINRLCPPFSSEENSNIFRHFFGVKFVHHKRIRPILQFEFAKCFSFMNALTHQLSHPSYQSNLDGGIPTQTSAWLFQEIHDALQFIRDSNTKISLPTTSTEQETTTNPTSDPTLATAAHFSGGIRLLSRRRGIKLSPS